MGGYTGSPTLPIVSALWAEHCIQGISSKANQRWMLAWFSVVWGLWLHRNSVIFTNETTDAERVFELAKIQSWHWLHSKDPSFKVSWYSWKVNLWICLGECFVLKFVLVGVHYITCMHMFVLLTSKRQCQVIFSLVPCHYINIVLFVEKKMLQASEQNKLKICLCLHAFFFRR